MWAFPDCPQPTQWAGKCSTPFGTQPGFRIALSDWVLLNFRAPTTPSQPLDNSDWWSSLMARAALTLGIGTPPLPWQKPDSSPPHHCIHETISAMPVTLLNASSWKAVRANSPQSLMRFSSTPNGQPASMSKRSALLDFRSAGIRSWQSSEHSQSYPKSSTTAAIILTMTHSAKLLDCWMRLYERRGQRSMRGRPKVFMMKGFARRSSPTRSQCCFPMRR